MVPNGSSIGHGAPAWIHPPDLEAVGPHGHLRSAPQGHQPCRQRHELMHLADFWKLSSSRDFFGTSPGFRFFGVKYLDVGIWGRKKTVVVKMSYAFVAGRNLLGYVREIVGI